MLFVSVYNTCVEDGGWRVTSGFLSFLFSVAFPHLSLLLGVNTHIHKRCTCCLCLCMYIYTCVEDGGRRVTSGFLSLCGFSTPSLTIGCKHSTRGVYMDFTYVLIV